MPEELWPGWSDHPPQCSSHHRMALTPSTWSIPFSKELADENVEGVNRVQRAVSARAQIISLPKHLRRPKAGEEWSRGPALERLHLGSHRQSGHLMELKAVASRGSWSADCSEPQSLSVPGLQNGQVSLAG